MKQYRYRLWCANTLIVAALLALAVWLLGRIVPALTETSAALLPALTIVVSVCALTFAILEAIFLYRGWESEAAREGETSP